MKDFCCLCCRRYVMIYDWDLVEWLLLEVW